MSGKKILVVEDDSVLREILVGKLKSSGYDVSGAEDGEVAMTELKRVKPDIVLLDILMPKKNGMEVLEEMHTDDDLKDIPVIIISNSGQPVEIARAKKLGARDFLIKAIFDPKEVLAKVKGVLNDGTEKEVTSENDGGIPSLPNEVEENQIDKKVPTKTGRGNILVVEDDKFLRELLTRKLFSEGFVIESAIDSKSTFDILTKWKPDIILLDLILPEEDGFMILEKIKKNKELANIPVIILSNLGQKEDVDRAIALGAMDFMVKANFTLDEITGKVVKALGGATN